MRAIPGAGLRGFFFRAIRLKYIATPLSALGSKLNGGRYNAPGSFEVFYLAPNAEVALRETQAVDPSGVPKRITPLTLFTIDVELQYIVDLTNDAALRALNLSAASITHEWRAAASAGTTPITHEIGTSARRADVEALLYRGARRGGCESCRNRGPTSSRKHARYQSRRGIRAGHADRGPRDAIGREHLRGPLGGQSKSHTCGQLKTAHQSVGTFKTARLIRCGREVPA